MYSQNYVENIDSIVNTDKSSSKSLEKIYPISRNSQTFKGRIDRIIEGDIFLFHTKDSSFIVHMYGIDAPESGQAFSEISIKKMESYLWNNAEIEIKKNINIPATSAILFIDGKNINKHMVKNGFAWHNKLHSTDAELARSEMYARSKKLGLWIMENPTPPWEFKRGVLAKPKPPDGEIRVLICTNEKDNTYHKKYCQVLKRCHTNVIVILRKQAKDIKMKACKYCY
jgi:endonuclease YncB( thermonuclease family)